MMLNRSSALFQTLKWMKRYLSVLPLAVVCLAGYFWFLMTGRTSKSSWGSLRKLFYITNGRFNNMLWRAIKTFKPPRPVREVNGFLGRLQPNDTKQIAAKLQQDGYYVFPQRIPEEVCEELMSYALTKPAKLSEIPKGEADPGPIVYDPQNPKSPTYLFGNTQSLYESTAVQKLLGDETFLAITEAYFRAQPIVDFIDLWWSTAFLKGRSSPGASQWYHFDMNRIKFLKFFFYLTDVNAENGPHCFIRGSHRRKPHGLLKDGRVPDEEMAKYYQPSDMIEFTGPRGTIIAEDTAGFHKGKGPVSGQRLIFQIQYTVSLFCNDYPKIVVNEKFLPEFVGLARSRPYTFSSFTGIK